jgi:zinc/manganese transport system substrate-binding protein
VVTGSSVVNDLTRRIGGDRFLVTCLVPAGIDPHHYQPVPDDVQRLATASLVVINGLGFEGWFDRLAKEASFNGTLVIASTGIVPLTMHEMHDLGDHQVSDPHAFHSLVLGVRYAETIRDALCVADPEGAPEIRKRAADLIASLRQCDGWARKEISRIPVTQRVIVTNHDALGYFARDYGFQIRAPNTALEDSEPSAKHLAELIDFVKTQGVKGVFLEAGKQAKVVEQIAHEAGVRLGGELYLDGLGPAGSPVDSYESMWKANITAIIRGLE